MSGVEDGSFIHFYDALERWSNSQVLKRKSIFSNASVVELLDGHCFIGHPGVSEVTFHSKKEVYTTTQKSFCLLSGIFTTLTLFKLWTSTLKANHTTRQLLEINLLKIGQAILLRKL